MLFKNVSVAERRDRILNGNVLSTLIQLSIPTIFMAVVGSLIPMLDGIFLNRNASSVVAGAVGMSASVINIIIGLSAGLSVATVSVIGQLNGLGDTQKIKKFASQIMNAGIVFGFGLAPLTFVGASILMRQAEEALRQPIWNYLSLYTCVIPMLFLASIYNAIKEATGQPESTFYRMIILLSLKICFNTIFLVKFSMGEKGASLASICSYIFITLWMYYDLYLNPKNEIRLSFKEGKLNKEALKPIIQLGLPSMANSVLINIGFFLINMEILKYGALVVNAQSIASNLNALTFTIPSAISSTVTTMISMNIGIGHVRQSKRIYFIACLVSIGLSIITITGILIFNKPLILLFRNDPDILEISQQALNIYTYAILPFGLFMITQGTFIAFGRTKIPLFTGFLRIWFLRYLFILATDEILGLSSVFYATLFSNSVACIIILVWLSFTKWESVLTAQILSDSEEKRYLSFEEWVEKHKKAPIVLHHK